MLLTLFALLIGVSPTWAEEITVCDGTATSQYVPVYGYYADSNGQMDEFIIPADKLSAVSGKSISQLTFYLSSSASAIWGATYEVFLKEVTESAFSSTTYSGKTGATVVYTGKLNATGSTMDIVFEDEYAYGGGNLLVGVYMTTKGSNCPSASFYGEESEGGSLWKSYSTSKANFIPKTTIIYGTPSIAKPKNVTASAVKSSTATVSWTAGGSETSWEISYGTDNTEPAEEGSYTSVSSTTYNLTGLSAETPYYFFVRAIDGTSHSKWASVNFTTTPVATSADEGYSDDFETANNWTLVNGTLTNAWAWGEATNNGGSKALYISNDGGTTYAYTPSAGNTMVYAKKLFSFDGGTYSFKYDWKGNGESSYDYLRVALVPATVTLTAGTAAPTNFSATGLPTGWIALDGGSKLNLKTDWQKVSQELAIEEGSYYVVFAWRNDGSGGTSPAAAIDNFSISVQSCPTPTGLAVSEITAHGAKLAWATTNNTWEVYCTTEEGTPDANVTVTGTSETNSYTFTGLAGETKYYVWVRSVSGEDKSEWAGTNFTTLISCAKPTALAASNITSSGATLTWTAGAAGQDNWEVEYSTTSDFTVSQTVSASPEATATLSSLTAGTTYYVRVRANCGGGDYSKWTDAISFTTLQTAVAADDGYTDDFETANNWMLVNGTQTNAWAWGTAVKKDGEKGLYISNDGGTTNAYTNTETYVYATKLFSFAGGAYSFTYDWKCVGESKYDYLRVALVPSTITLTAGTNAGFNSSNTNLPSGWISLDESTKLSASSEWARKNIEMNVEPGIYNVVFVWVNDGSSSNGVPAAVDNFSVSVLSCPTPTNLAVSDITAHEATLTWTETNNTWEVYHSTSSEAPDANVTVTGTTETNSYTFTGLKGATTYYVWVRSVSGESKSEWVGASLTTEPSCIAPSNLAVSAVTDNSVTLIWTDDTEGQDTWEVSYSTTSGDPDNGTIVKVNAKTAEITGLTVGTTYYAYVRAFCAEDDQSAWSEVCSFEPGIYTANNGTSTNSYVPLYGYYADNSTGIRSQFIIPSTSLSAISNSEITKMVFHASQSNVSWGNNASFDVYMKEVTETGFENATLVDWANLDKVYSGKLSVTGNKMTIELPEAFEYTDGNLMIGICQTAKGSEGSVTWYGTTTENYVAIGGYATTLNRYQFLPKVSFTFSPIANGPKMVLSTDALDFGMVSPAATEEAKQLTFTIKNKGKSDMTDINVSCEGDAFTTTEVSDATIAVGGEDITVTVTINTENPGDYAGTITVSAASIESQTINVSGTVLDPTKMFEDFAGNALPDFWTTKSIGSSAGSWNFTNGYAQYTTSGYASNLNNYKSALVSPEEMTFTDNEKVKFMVKKDRQFDTYESYLLVQHSADGTTWTDVAEGAFNTVDLSDDFELKQVTIPATAKQIRFVACGVSIDNVYGGTLPTGARFAIFKGDAEYANNTTQDFGFVKQNDVAEQEYTITNDGNNGMNVIYTIPEGFTVESDNALLFTSTKGWTSVYVHAWGNNGNLTVWPGVPATYVGTNDMNEPQFAFVVPEGATGIVINNGGSEQTPDINNFNVEGYYLYGDLYDGNKYWAGSWGDAPTRKGTYVAAGESETFTVKMNTETPGAKSGNVKLAFKAIGQSGFTIPVTGYVADNSKIYVDFVNNELPNGWTNSSFTISNNEASYNGYVATLTTPAITVAEGEKLVIYARGLMTSRAQLDVKTSTDNGATWSDAVKTFTTELRQNTTDYVVLTVDNIDAGNYKLKLTGDYVAISIINGYTYNQDAPALGVTLAGANITTGYEDNFGTKVKEALKHTYTIKNTGTGTLTGTITSSVTDHFTVSESEFSLGKDETLDFDLSLVFDENYGEKASAITIHPNNAGLADIVINASATTKDPNIWEEDFENGMPAFWTTTGWTVSSPYYGGNGTKVIGPGNNTTATLTTPRLQATEGQKLKFDVIGAESEYYSIKMQYSTDDQETWSEIVTYTDAGTKEFIAPADGLYYLRFTGNYTYLDNFEGFKLALPDHIMAITASNIPTSGSYSPTMKATKSFTATVTVKESRGVAEENVIAKLYMGDEVIGTSEATSFAANESKVINITATPTVAATEGAEMHIEVEYAGGTLKTDVVTRYVAELVRLDMTDTSEPTIETGYSAVYDVVTLTRSFVAGWNTFVAPLAVAKSEFGEGAKFYSFTGYADGALKFSTVTGETLNPATPYIIYVPAAIAEKVFTWESPVIYSSYVGTENIKVTDGGATFQGTYAPIAAPGMEDKWGVTSEARIAKGTETASIKGFRAYFELPDGANGARLSFYDDATGITTVIGADKLNDDKAYNLGGQRVQNPKKGLYIINGKKVVIK